MMRRGELAGWIRVPALLCLAGGPLGWLAALILLLVSLYIEGD